MNGRATREEKREQPVIAVLGPCASGKSTLVENLRKRGYNAKEVNQEHSYVPTMWQRFAKPDVLIYLEVSQDVASERRSSEESAAWWDELEVRLRHASRHADLRIETDELSPEEVLASAVSFLERGQDASG